MNLKYQVTDTDNPEELSGRLNDVFEKLQSLGLVVRQSSAGDILMDCDVHTPGYETIKWMSSTTSRTFTMQQFHYDRALSSYHLALLVRLCEQVIFLQGLDQLSQRVAQLGWIIKLHPTDISIECDSGRTIRYWQNEEELRNLQELIEQEELERELFAHTEEFRRARICITRPRDGIFEVSLQEGDPSLTRRLTRENVQRIIALARVWNKLSA